MANQVVVGLQWGDEGKGKIVDLLASKADVVARFQGGNNAGHTLVVDGNQLILGQVAIETLAQLKQLIQRFSLAVVRVGCRLFPWIYCSSFQMHFPALSATTTRPRP